MEREWDWPREPEGERRGPRVEWPEIEGGAFPEVVRRWALRREIGPEEFAGGEPETVEEAAEALGAPAGARAAAAALRARRAHGLIGIVADYDVDGATSAAIVDALLGGGTPIEVGERNSEGYGAQGAALERLYAGGCRSAVVLDTGTTQGPLLDAWTERGLACIVVDHHPPRGGEVPTRGIVVNPWAQEGESHRDLCTAGLAWWIGWWWDRMEGERRPDHRRTVLAGIGARCDVMSHTPGTPGGRFNRALSTEAARRLDEGGPGVEALLRAAGRTESEADVETLEMVLGPRLNAASRMGRSALAAALLCADSHEEASKHARTLEALNVERRALQAEVLARALEGGWDRGGIAIVADRRCPAGVAGPVAAKLVEAWGRPAIVLGWNEAQGCWMGSGRAAPGGDVGGFVERTAAEVEGVSGGGHRAACGVRASEGALEALVDRAAWEAVSQDPLVVDMVLGYRSAEPGRAQRAALAIERLGPWGKDWRRPLVGVRGARLAEGRRFRGRAGGEHVGLQLEAGTHGLEAVAWNAGEALKAAVGAQGERWGGGGRRLDVAGRLTLRTWRERRSAQLVVEALRPAR